MKCPEFTELMRLHDGELTEGETKAILSHLDACTDCRRTIDYLRKTEQAWREDYREPTDAQFSLLKEKLMKEVFPKRKLQKFIPAVAAVLIALLGTTFILINRDTVVSEALQDDHLAVQEPMGKPDSSDDTAEPVQPAGQAGDTASRFFDGETEEVLTSEEETPINTAESEDSGTASNVIAADGSSGSDSGLECEGTGDLKRDIITGGTVADEESLPESIVESDEVVITYGASSSAGGCPPGNSGTQLTAEQNDSALQQPSGDAEVCESILLREATEISLSAGMVGSTEESESQNLEQAESVDTIPHYRITLLQNGIPDSLSTIVLDSLFSGWRDYIPLMLVDSVLAEMPDELENILRLNAVQQ